MSLYKSVKKRNALLVWKNKSVRVPNHLDTSNNTPDPRENKLTENQLKDTSTDNATFAATFVSNTTNDSANTYISASKSTNTREEDVNKQKNNSHSLVNLRSVTATHYLSNHTGNNDVCFTGSPSNRDNNLSYPINWDIRSGQESNCSVVNPLMRKGDCVILNILLLIKKHSKSLLYC